MDVQHNIIIPTSECPDCSSEWFNGKCPTCGILQTDVETLLSSAIIAYQEARHAALGGCYSEAYRLAKKSREIGLRHPALDRLYAICAATLGDWDGLQIDALPEEWAQSLRTGALATEYGASLNAAKQEDWQNALTGASKCISIAPWFLPGQKLRILSLVGLGHMSEAIAICGELLIKSPNEPDINRMVAQLASQELATSSVVTSSKVKVHRAPSSMKKLVLRASGIFLMVGIATGLGIGRFFPLSQGNGGQIARVSQEYSTVRPTQSQPIIQSMLAQKTQFPNHDQKVAFRTTYQDMNALDEYLLPERLQAQLLETHRQADVQQARRWMNAALRSRSVNNLAQADRYSTAAAVLGRGSYIEDNALLLSAQVAEKRGEFTKAIKQYSLICTSTPDSAYAALGLAAAARLTDKHGKVVTSAKYRNELEERYPNSREAKRVLRLKIQQTKIKDDHD